MGILPLTESNWRILRAERDRTVILFKDSPFCGVSAWAAREIAQFSAASGTDVLRVDVIAQRAFARALAEELSVPHASPQVVVVRDGRVHWHGSHGDLTAEALAKAKATAPLVP
jgi:bacillithiol system protein YtxJ